MGQEVGSKEKMSNYNRDNVKGKYIEDKRELIADGLVGDWSFDSNQDITVAILIRCPDGSPSGCVGRLPLGGNGWNWDGNREGPTLSPSIDRLPIDDYKPGWHGWLRGGELVSV